MLAISLDGRLASSDGGAAQLGCAGDRRALEESLAWADAVLIGAGTLRAHRCTCLIRDADLLEARRMAQRSDQPVAVVVSRQPSFGGDWRFFRQPLTRWLLSPRNQQAGFDRWMQPKPTWTESLGLLAQQGLQRIVLLGGARLTASLLQDDSIDELQLTLTPRLLGGDHCWVPLSIHGTTLPRDLWSREAWSLAEATRLGADELLVRYSRRRS